jgi:hypothetical protein
VACPVDQADSAQIGLLQQLETELLPAIELEIERRLESYLVGLVGYAVAAAEAGNFG